MRNPARRMRVRWGACDSARMRRKKEGGRKGRARWEGRIAEGRGGGPKEGRKEGEGIHRECKHAQETHSATPQTDKAKRTLERRTEGRMRERERGVNCGEEGTRREPSGLLGDRRGRRRRRRTSGGGQLQVTALGLLALDRLDNSTETDTRQNSCEHHRRC